MTSSPDTPFNAGYDSLINGANEENCNFKWFETTESKDE